jgi:hypothetical protein
VDVRAYLNDPLGLSIAPKTVSGPPRALETVLPIVPTTVRDVSKKEVAGGFVRISQGGTGALQPVTLDARVANDRGAAVHEQTETFEPVRFSTGRRADYPFEIRVVSWAPPRSVTVERFRGRGQPRRVARRAVHRAAVDPVSTRLSTGCSGAGSLGRRSRSEADAQRRNWDSSSSAATNRLACRMMARSVPVSSSR